MADVKVREIIGKGWDWVTWDGDVWESPTEMEDQILRASRPNSRLKAKQSQKGKWRVYSIMMCIIPLRCLFGLLIHSSRSLGNVS